MEKGYNKMKDIFYSSGKSAEELFSSKNEISRENFHKMIKISSKDPFLTDLIIDSVYFNLTKMDRNITIEEFKKAF